ncbi:MAG TPA: cbb3-type cytochrome c oxidase N-terminal domain-containing protein [Chitinophagales bacterium]|nr:cbb3-type cytochrome c oxidase N-terminal domain-containing protein [Chitinophagales bacterium]
MPTIKATVAILAALLPFVTMAQTVPAAAPVTPASSTVDIVWWIILGVMALLLLAILILSNMLVNVARMIANKGKAKTLSVLLLILLSSNLWAQDAVATAATAQSVKAFADWNLIMAGAVMVTLMFTVFVLLIRIRTMLNELEDKPAAEPLSFEVHFPKFLDNFNASVAIEKEKDILLDHNYDGIKELDNNLPPWWKYSFYISIVWAIAYTAYYDVLGGPTSHDEYEAAVAQAKINQEAYARTHANMVDENTVTLADAAGISDGADIFKTNCTPCHGQSAEGGIGPNLTDDYWLHGGSIKDVFKTIKYGWPNKGMKSWQADLSPSQIRDVASYVKSLHGTKPANAKAPQGELYSEGGAVAAADSSATAAKTDSTTAVSK